MLPQVPRAGLSITERERAATPVTARIRLSLADVLLNQGKYDEALHEALASYRQAVSDDIALC